MRRMRLPSPGSAPRAARADARPYRLRRVLRHRRETRQSRDRRQARHHRRRQARRGVGGLLHRPHLRRALGDADVQGAGAVPAGGRDPARHGEICQGRPRGAPRHAGADAAGRAALDRRGLSRSGRHPARARHDPGQGAGALCPQRSSATSGSRFRSACPATSSSPRSPPTSTSRAALPRSIRTRRARCWPTSRSDSFSASGRRPRNGWSQRGFRTIADLQRADEIELMKQFPTEGRRLWRLARGIDDRRVVPDRGAKTISSETTFENDIRDFATLEKLLWRLSEKVSARLKNGDLAGSTITLKLKTADFRQRTRSQSIARADPAGGEDLCGDPRNAGEGDRRHRVPPDGRRRQRAARRARRPTTPTCSTAARPMPNARWTICARNSARRAVIRGIAYDGPEKAE